MFFTSFLDFAGPGSFFADGVATVAFDAVVAFNVLLASVVWFADAVAFESV